MPISSADAKLELVILNSNAQVLDRVEVVTRLTNADIPMEIIFRIEELWEATKLIAGQIIHIGKVVVLEILRFIDENKNLATGIALGAAVGALIGLIPFIGPLLAPLTAAIGALIGGFAGMRLDRGAGPENGISGIVQDAIVIARKFFELLAAIFKILKAEYDGKIPGDAS
jgi:hypothetical protein